MRQNSPALSNDGAGSFFSEGGWDGKWGVGGERWICSVGVLRVEKVVFGGVWKKQQYGDNWEAFEVSESSVQCRDGFSGVFEGAADQSPSPQKR